MSATIDYTQRKGDWFQVYTGGRYYPADPHPGDLTITDIAHALSMICRFGGHVRRFYSVAQHSVLCLDIARARGEGMEVRRWALLHDTPEAVLGDVVRPLKSEIGEAYKRMEYQNEVAILFGLNVPAPSKEVRRIVHEIDNIALITERNQLVNYNHEVWNCECAPFPITINTMSPYEAELNFLQAWEEIRP